MWADSETVVSSHTDGKVRVWDVTSGRLLAEVGDADIAPFIAVTPDGRHLVTSAQGEALVWTLDVDELLEMATAQVSRTFTQPRSASATASTRARPTAASPPKRHNGEATRSRDLGPQPTDPLAH